jgi:hypothetical protein
LFWKVNNLSEGKVNGETNILQNSSKLYVIIKQVSRIIYPKARLCKEYFKLMPINNTETLILSEGGKKTNTMA